MMSKLASLVWFYPLLVGVLGSCVATHASAPPAASPRPGANAPTSAPRTAYLYTSGYGSPITIFTLDMTTGKLTPRGSIKPGIQSPSYLAISPNRQNLYAINEAIGPESKVVAFKIRPADGLLEKINEAPAGGNGSAHLSVHPSGRFVLIAHYGSGDVATVAIDSNGGVTSPPVDTQHPADEKSHQILTDRTGAYVFVPNVGSNTVFQFKLDSVTGKLTNNGSVQGFPENAGPRHLAFHPTQNVAYTINELGETVTSLRYDPQTGKLSAPRTIDSLPPGASRHGVTGAHILVHPNGRFVYTSNRGHDSISVFDVNQATGDLTMSANETGGGSLKTPRDFGLDPTGKFLVVANQDRATLSVFEVNPANGKLTLTGTQATPGHPAFAQIVFLP